MDEAFSALKDRITSVPIVIIPDPKIPKQFVMEVDASDVGNGAQIVQRAQEDSWLHLCAYLS